MEDWFKTLTDTELKTWLKNMNTPFNQWANSDDTVLFTNIRLAKKELEKRRIIRNNNLLTAQETLKIWRGLPEELQRATVKEWQKETGNKWTFEMVSASTITLKRILSRRTK